jgi:putative NIF3 family GTP cyclohydrolase 1 type 2
MSGGDLSRRHFALLAGSGMAAAALGQSSALSAREVIERIRKNVGVPWREQTVDTFKAGNPETPVKGIATTFMATLDVLQRSAAAGKNLIVTHEPTFWNHQDQTNDFSGDPVYTFKQNFVEKNNLVVWRFHDHWHARKPDAMFTGLVQRLGWDKYQDGDNQRFYNVPTTTLGQIAKDAQRRLKIRALRVIGDPQTKISKIAVNPGFANLMGAIHLLQQADLLVVGEPREWEGVEYAQDAIASGQKKGMLLLGHAISEDPGMDLCATWLKTFVPEVPVEWVPAGEPFWRPA